VEESNGDDSIEEEDPISELVSEVEAAAERAELSEVAAQVEMEHRQQAERELAERRTSRIDELYDRTIGLLHRIQEAGPLRFVQSSSMEPGARPINVRWEKDPKRHIVLDFNRYRGTIRVWQLTTADGADVTGGRVSREIDAADDRAEAEIERAIRWVWHEPPEPQP
jgi:hypothetical protein